MKLNHKIYGFCWLKIFNFDILQLQFLKFFGYLFAMYKNITRLSAQIADYNQRFYKQITKAKRVRVQKKFRANALRKSRIKSKLKHEYFLFLF